MNDIQARDLSAENAALRAKLAALEQAHGAYIHGDRLCSIEQLSAGIVHEINNPLGIVLSNSETLASYLVRIVEILRMYRKGVPLPLIQRRERQMRLETILDDVDLLVRENVGHIEDIAEVVRTLRQFSTDGFLREFVQADIADIVRSIQVLSRASARGVAEIVISTAGNHIVECVPAEIAQALMIIVGSSVEVLAMESVRAPGRIEIEVAGDDNSVNIVVRDSGPQITEDLLIYAFDPAVAVRAGRTDGGLARALAWDVVTRMHGGTITVANCTGGGVAVTVVLPRTRRHQ